MDICIAYLHCKNVLLNGSLIGCPAHCAMSRGGRHNDTCGADDVAVRDQQDGFKRPQERMPTLPAYSKFRPATVSRLLARAYAKQRAKNYAR
jgi:hypothetical protein